MKKTILILGLSLMATGAFAGNVVENKSYKSTAEECCKRTAVDEDGDVLVSVRICGEGSSAANCVKAEYELGRIIKALTPA